MEKLLKRNGLLCLFVCTVTFLGLLIACNNSTTNLGLGQQLGKIEPPIPELAKKYTNFDIDPAQENVLELPSGTIITVPASALVDETGKPITGKATITYREYHDAIDVLLSGIPMDYHLKNQKRTMQTAGMFDLNGNQNGKPIFVKEGVGIQVDFASFEEGNDYNFFSLDENQGWEFIDYVAPVPNEGRTKLEKEVVKLSRQLKGQKKNLFVFNYNSILDITYNNNWSEIVKNKTNPSVLIKAKKYGLDYYKSTVYQFINYKGNQYPVDMMVWRNKGGEWPSWSRKEACQLDVKPIKGNLYRITVKKDNKIFVGKIEAIVPLKYMFQYSPEKWKKNAKSIMKEVSVKEEKLRIELEEKRKKMEQQAAVIRSFEVAGFGIYNYDKLLKEDNRIDIIANFEMDNTENLEWVICLPEDGKTVIKYPRKDWNKVALLPNNAARFMTILTNKKVGVYTVEAYQKIAFEELKTKIEKPTITFKLVQVIEQLDSEKRLRALMNDSEA